jgi:hypothetical protein
MKLYRYYVTINVVGHDIQNTKLIQYYIVKFLKGFEKKCVWLTTIYGLIFIYRGSLVCDDN